MRFREKTFRRKRVYTGKSVNFSADEIILPDGNKAVREYMEHPGAVCVLPFIDKKNIILVRQYRYPVKEVTYELPAGKIDKNEKPLMCVKRELEEETGFTSKKILKLASFWPTAAFSDEIIHIYAARQLIKGTHSPDEDEFLQTVILPFEKVLEMVKKGKIRDSKSMIGIMYWAVFGRSFQF
jgi:ADP-ribose pyrophosphatase